MAGIGFALRRLAQQDTLSAGVFAYAHATAVSSGPWLFTILALGGVELLGRNILEAEDLQRFSLILIYDFAFSLVTSGPVVLVVTRRLADQIHAKDISNAPGMFLGALVLIFAVQAVIGIPFYGFFVDLTFSERILALIAFQMVGGIWLAAAFMSALKNFGSISMSFGLGTGFAFLAAVLLAPSFGVVGMLAGFTAGLGIILFGLAAQLLAEYPHPVQRPFAFLSGFHSYWEFALVGLLYNAAIWVDKWIMWFAPGRVLVAGMMPANPAYDGAMFLAYLTIVPAMAMFLVSIETRFFESYLRFYRNIENHATAAEIWSNHQAIVRDLGQGLRKIAILQAAMCYFAILVGPGLIGMVRGGVEMVSIFRFGVLGAMFHVLLLSVMVIIAYFDFRRLLLSVAALFFVLNTALTLATIWLGLGYQGYGYLLAALFSLIYAYCAAASRILKLPYMTFIGNNRGLR